MSSSIQESSKAKATSPSLGWQLWAQIIVIVLLSTYAYSGTDPYSEEGLLNSVNMLAKRLPMQVDAVTSISGVALLNNKTIQYRYNLNKEKIIQMAAHEAKMPVDEFSRTAIDRFGSIDNLMAVWSKEVLSKLIISENCSTPDTKKWINHGVTLVHTIFDNKGVFLHEEIVAKGKCK